MKLLYIAFAQLIHTIKWINYFKRENEVMLISFNSSQPIEGIELIYLPVKNTNLAVIKLNAIKKIIKKFKPDIVHSHYASSCGLVAALSNFHPYVLSVWGDDILKFPNKSPMHKWVVRKAIKSADYVTATSQMLADSTMKLMDHNMDIHVIPFGVDLNQYVYFDSPPKEVIHIGIVRNLTPKYGLECLNV